MSADDVTGWCIHGKHDSCTNLLLSATGSHWWCACLCHPEPVIHERDAHRKDFIAALATWRKARTALAGSPRPEQETSK